MWIYKRINLENWWYFLKRNIDVADCYTSWNNSDWSDSNVSCLNSTIVNELLEEMFNRVNGVKPEEVEWILNKLFEEAKLNEQVQAQLLSIKDILDNAWYTTEKVHSWKGIWDTIYSEILLRPWNNLDTWVALQLFNETNTTYKLFEVMISFAFEEAKKTGNSVSVNAYFADISNEGIVHLFASLMSQTNLNLSKIILEVLEVRVWDLDSTAIRNLKTLSNLWVKVAVDDFIIDEPRLILKKSIEKMDLEDFKEHYLSSNMSMWVIDTLLEAGIHINYIKLDWKFVHRILNWQCSPNVILMTKAILKKAKETGTKIIWEWFDHPDQVEKLSKVLVNIDWAQWRNFPEEGFSRQTKKENISFKPCNEVKSFAITNSQGTQVYIDISRKIRDIMSPFKGSRMEDKPKIV